MNIRLGASQKHDIQIRLYKAKTCISKGVIKMKSIKKIAAVVMAAVICLGMFTGCENSAGGVR